jgi:hypothetical protein
MAPNPIPTIELWQQDENLMIWIFIAHLFEVLPQKKSWAFQKVECLPLGKDRIALYNMTSNALNFFNRFLCSTKTQVKPNCEYKIP